MSHIDHKELLIECRKIFTYKDGRLVRKNGKGGTYGTKDYRKVRLSNKAYREHQIIFLMHHGYVPKVIDHIDRNIHNNAIENLREVSKRENRLNSKIRRDSSSGYKGVNYLKLEKKWRARITHFGRRIHLGRFNTKEDAARSYNLAARMYHGKFAHTNIITT